MLNRQVMVVAVAIALALVVAPRLLVWARRSAAPQKLAPYVQTPQDVVERMLQIAQVGRNDVVYDWDAATAGWSSPRPGSTAHGAWAWIST